MASRTLAYARACYRWAMKRGKVFANPFQDLPVPAGTSDRDRVLTDDELFAVWTAASTLPYPFGPFFQLAILTLQRREEVAGMRWSEISADMVVWTIPGERMKNGRPHDLHLSEAARAVLRAVPKVDGCDYVFSTTGKTPISGFSRGKAALDAAVTAVRNRRWPAETDAALAVARSSPHWRHDPGAAGVRQHRRGQTAGPQTRKAPRRGSRVSAT